MEGIVAAGALAPPSLRELGVERIPLLSIAGETLLMRACRCLIDGAGCQRVHVLAPEELPLPQLPQVQRARYSGMIVSDLVALVRDEITSPEFILAGADSPLLTPEAVAAVKQSGRQLGADLVYPVCERSVVERRHPGTQRTYARIGGKQLTGGNVFYLKRELVLRSAAFLDKVFALRKNPLGLARLFGLWFMLRFLLGAVDLPYVERHLGNLLGGRLRAAALPYPELVVDLDKAADLEFFKSQLDPWD